MTENITIVLAIWGAATGTLSLVVAAVGALQTSRYYLRPRINFHWPDDYSGGWDWEADPPGLSMARLTIRNDGSATARGVRIWISTASIYFSREPWLTPADLEPGKEMSLLVPLEPVQAVRKGTQWFDDDVTIHWESSPVVWPTVTIRHADRSKPLISRCPNLDKKMERERKALDRAYAKEIRRNPEVEPADA